MKYTSYKCENCGRPQLHSEYQYKVLERKGKAPKFCCRKCANAFNAAKRNAPKDPANSSMKDQLVSW